MQRQQKFFAAIGLQVLVIFAIILFKLSVLNGGTAVLVHIRPVDPRDLLRGDYVTFQYDISQISGYSINGGTVRDGDTVYVSLIPNGKYYSVRSASKTKPTSGLFITGKVDSLTNNGILTQLPTSFVPSNQNIHIKYGAEEYFIPEGTGRNVSFWNQDVSAQLVIDDNGNAVLKQIFLNDKPWP